MPRCRSLLAALPFALAPALTLTSAALISACGLPDETHALRALATVRARVTLPADVVAARIALYSAVDGDAGALEAVEVRRVEPVAAHPTDDRRDAYALFAVRSGEHRLVVTPLAADDRLAPGCVAVEATVTVDAPAFTEVELAPLCDGSAAVIVPAAGSI